MGRIADAWRTLWKPGWDAKLEEHDRRFRALALEVNATLDKLMHAVWRDTKRRQRALEGQLELEEPAPAPAPASASGSRRGAIAARVRAQLANPTTERTSDEPTDGKRAEG